VTKALFRLLSLLALPLTAFGAETPSPGVSAGGYMQAMLALAVIVGLLFGLAWLARKISGGRGFGGGGMKVVGGVALSPRERIVLVEVGETWLVIGIVPGQIRTLHRLPKGEEIPTEQIPSTPDAPFAEWLKTIVDRKKNV